FAILMPVVFGLSFQLPLVMLFLERVGVFTVETYRRQWKAAFMVLTVVAALMAPPDLWSMILLIVPMLGLYWSGILLCQLRSRNQNSGLDVPEPEEVVEV